MIAYGERSWILISEEENIKLQDKRQGLITQSFCVARVLLEYRHEMVGWHHRFDGHEFKQAAGVGDGQGSLARCSPWGHKESDPTK